VGRICVPLATLGLTSILLPRYLWFRRGRAPADSRSGCLADGEGPALAYTHLQRGHDRIVIVAHGFMKSKDLPAIVDMCAKVSAHVDVLALDFPGHGESGGLAALDFPTAARHLGRVVAYARDQGYASVGVLGYSMGAAAALIAAAGGAPIDAIVAVSSPVGPRASWVSNVLGGCGFYAERPKPVWRSWARLLGTRLAPWHQPGVWPIEVVARLPSVPVLFVHCGLDTLIRREQTAALYALARPPKAYLCAPYALHASPVAGAGQVLDWLERSLPVGEAGDRKAAEPVEANHNLQEVI
jgi:pimeloyl-ACP methyl ester carboxylesterase